MSDDQTFKVPSWAGKPAPGLHLDVVKNGSVLQKLLIDEKSCYMFGRAKELCDFPLPHQSCSREHAALVYHKHLNRPFLIDLGSTHGTFVGTMRLEPHKPTQLPMDTTLSFGASTRTYTLRERPQTVNMVMGEEGREEGEGGTLLGLPELDTEVDDLTQYNTAHNRQISMVGIVEGEKTTRRKYRPHSISFSDSEEVINPEDVDPTVGKFRNMIQTTILPNRKRKLSSEAPPTPPSPSSSERVTPSPSTPSQLPISPSAQVTSPTLGFSSSLFTKTITAAPPVHSPWSRQPQAPPPPLMGFSGGFSGGGGASLYGNHDVGRYLSDAFVYSIAACAALSLGRRGRPFLSLVSVSRHLPPSYLTRPYLETAMAAATPPSLPSLGLLLCVFVCACRAFYIPGVAPTEYEEGDKLEIKAVKMTSVKTQLPYEYYSLPFCKPKDKDIHYKTLNLGEVLRGDRIVNTPYQLSVLKNEECVVLCEMELAHKQVRAFSQRIEEDYTLHMLADNLPAATVFRNLKSGDLQYEDGFKLGFSYTSHVVLNNHLKIRIKYHPVIKPEGTVYRIVGFEVEPQSIHSSAMSRVEGDKCQVQRDDMKVMELKNSNKSRWCVNDPGGITIWIS